MPAETLFAGSLLSDAFIRLAASVLLTVVAIAFGGTFVLRVVQGAVPATALQKSFFRAGHAHAGVLVTLGLVVCLVVDLAGVSGMAAVLSTGVLWGAILIPAGFFLSVTYKGAEKPNQLIALLWLGAASVMVGVVAAAVGLLTL